MQTLAGTMWGLVEASATNEQGTQLSHPLGSHPTWVAITKPCRAKGLGGRSRAHLPGRRDLRRRLSEAAGVRPRRGWLSRRSIARTRSAVAVAGDMSAARLRHEDLRRRSTARASAESGSAQSPPIRGGGGTRQPSAHGPHATRAYSGHRTCPDADRCRAG
jgi:hypothetical protein